MDERIAKRIYAWLVGYETTLKRIHVWNSATSESKYSSLRRRFKTEVGYF